MKIPTNNIHLYLTLSNLGKRFMATILGLALMESVCLAQSMFSDSLQGGQSSVLSEFTTWNGTAGVWNFDASGVYVTDTATPVNNNDRSYLRTIGTDYSSISWIATVTVLTTDNHQAWFGLGPGVGGGTYDEPTTSPNSYMRLWTGNTGQPQRVFINGTSTGTQVAGWKSSGTFTMQLKYDSAVQTITYSLYEPNNGNKLDGTDTVSLSGVSWGSGNASIFFGAGAGDTFSNFSVGAVPEPSIAAISGLGGIACFMLFRRRR